MNCSDSHTISTIPASSTEVIVKSKVKLWEGFEGLIVTEVIGERLLEIVLEFILEFELTALELLSVEFVELGDAFEFASLVLNIEQSTKQVENVSPGSQTSFPQTFPNSFNTLQSTEHVSN